MRLFVKILPLILALGLLFCEGCKNRRGISSQDENDLSQKMDKTILAQVGNQLITVRDFEDVSKNIPSYLKNEFGTLEGKKKLLNKMISRILLYEEGVRKGFLNDEAVKKDMDEYSISLVSEMVKSRYLNEKRTEDALKSYFKKNKDKYSKKGKMPKYDDVKSAVKEDLSKEILNGYIEDLKKNTKIVLNQELLETPKGNANAK